MIEENIFNLEHTLKAQELCKVPKDKRDDLWLSEFLKYIPTASMTCASPQVIVGPDGFQYFVLNFPERGKSFESYSIKHVIPHVLKKGCGIIINLQDKGKADCIFSFGDIWNFKETGFFISDPPRWPGLDIKEDSKIDRKIITSPPSRTYLPDYVREVISSYLLARFNISVGVFLITDLYLNPSLNLVFNIFPEDFKDQKVFNYIQKYIIWALPRDYGVISINSTSELVEKFSPL